MRTLSAREIAAAVMPGRTPTDEQVAVIEAPWDEPCVVVAGAGSGKTETMSARVVWLVVNGFVRPEEVLGLTFTRKAAQELGERIRRRLRRLRQVGLVDDELLLSGDATVSTYDAYAGRIVAEQSLRLGEEPGRTLITDAVAWQLATRIAESYRGDMTDVDKALSTVVQGVMDLHDELTGHLVEPTALTEFTDQFIDEVRVVPDAPRVQGPYAGVKAAVNAQRARLQLLPLVERFRAEKRRREVLDFGDQAALAARLADSFPEIGAGERERYRVVLLDEYQDTSHAQLVMLRGLFGGGHPVTAVGDPRQSIYGWRGASARTITTFAEHFPTASGRPAVWHSLTVSFRNGPHILHAANVVSSQLRDAVPGLRAWSGNAVGQVVVAMHDTVDDEATDIARRARAEWDREAPRPTMAVLVRKRSQIARIVAALQEVGLPVEVVGVGGLLTTPEVADVRATLQVLSDPTRGDALMRLLTGARWRIGPRDLDALGRWARRLARQRRGSSSTQGHPESIGSTPGAVASNADAADAADAADDTIEIEPDEVDERSIVDALDALPPRGWFSPTGRERFTWLAAELRSLRARAAQPLPDLVADVVHTLRLDIELASEHGDMGTARVNIDAFLDVAADFGRGGDESTLPAFLAYLDAAEQEERGLAAGQVEVSGDRIQVLTVHGAKGLEWEVVFVPGLVERTFPSGGETDKAWLGALGSLPFPLRGDRAGLPELSVSAAADQKELSGLVADFTRACGAVGRLEERRLAYVAVTRAERLLVCSGYRWGTGVRPVGPSPFLLELRDACAAGFGEIGPWAPAPVNSASNPVISEPSRVLWPIDPLIRRRAEVAAGAERVRAAAARPAATESDDRWGADLRLLLAEHRDRSTRRGADVVVPMPAHLSVSQLVLLGKDPAALARAIRRPAPAAPNALARRGTAFHAWLEGRWRAPRLLDDGDLPGSADEGAVVADDLAALQEAFLASDWAHRTPVEVEAPFELLLDGVLLRGRADAVFEDDDGLDVVDWKTGAPPTSAADLAAKAVQLAAYRLAWSRLRGLPVERVTAAFHHVRHNQTIRPADLLDEHGLVALINSVPQQDMSRSEVGDMTKSGNAGQSRR